MFYVLYGIRGRGRTMRETETVGTVYSQNYRQCTKGGSWATKGVFQNFSIFYFRK